MPLCSCSFKADLATWGFSIVTSWLDLFVISDTDLVVIILYYVWLGGSHGLFFKFLNVSKFLWGKVGMWQFKVFSVITKGSLMKTHL